IGFTHIGYRPTLGPSLLRELVIHLSNITLCGQDQAVVDKSNLVALSLIIRVTLEHPVLLVPVGIGHELIEGGSPCRICFAIVWMIMVAGNIGTLHKLLH